VSEEFDMSDVRISPAEVFANGARLAGDIILPGVSQAVSGDIKSGATHAAIALGATALLGGVFAPLVWTAVGLDSYSRSVTGKGLADHFEARKAS